MCAASSTLAKGESGNMQPRCNRAFFALIPRCSLMAYAIGATSNHAKSGNFSPQKAVSSNRKKIATR